MSWVDDNQCHLTAALARVRAALTSNEPEPESNEKTSFALDVLVDAFELSPFERDVLLLCAGLELDSSFAALCPSGLNFSFALASLPSPHWSALTPNAPLRRWRLIELGAGPLTTCALRIDERILHYLAGINELDERLRGIAEGVSAADDESTAADEIVRVWSSRAAIVQLHGRDAGSRRTAAGAACARLGLGLLALSPQALPANGPDLDALMRLLDRELYLTNAALLIECDGVERIDGIRYVVEHLRAPVVIASRERRRITSRPSIAIELPRPTPAEQRRRCLEILGDAGAALDGQLDALIANFALSPRALSAVAQNACDDSPEALAMRLWDACREQSRGAMDDLAQRIDARAEWDDLVLPDAASATLCEIASQVRHRGVVYDRWGFANRQWRGSGVSALFAGGSGTGKTLAAEVLARELRLDLYRIDLSQVVNKYVGETEKNLCRLFDAAEDSGAILLFDEADALFGKRTEVRDSHDRFANIEVSYLLQRMESYRGLAVLTTNLRQALDSSFVRRLRFIVEFPFPDAGQRTKIWRRIFPDELPREGVDAGKLARLTITGGNIRNIALNAAFLAAAAGTPLRMTHLLDASRREYAKLDRSLTDAEVTGWV